VTPHPLTWVDVFTSTPMAGNPVAVVHDADDLSDATMLAFARETGLVETTFVQSSTRPEATHRTRIWTPQYEMPFAGHPSLGTAVAVLHRRGEADGDLVQETHAGLQPLCFRDGHASMLQEPATFGPELDAAEVLAVLGLDPAAAHPDLPAGPVSTGAAHVLVPVVGPDVLDAAAPSAEPLRALLRDHDAHAAYLVAWDPGAGRAQARSFYVEGDAVLEDPATGSAAGPLLALLHARTGAERVDVAQGVRMGRPSAIACAVEGERIRVAGDTVLLAEGVVQLQARARRRRTAVHARAAALEPER
jgi:trans-2,3-dihydro-3-hydroxyanthranilate isomerase